jgi:hypothetical protein
MRDMSLVTWFPRTAIVDFLRANTNDLEKYNELVAAVIWSKWQSYITGISDLPIGIPVKNKMSHMDFGDAVGVDQMEIIIGGMKEDYSTLDVVISNIPFDDIGDRSKRPFGWNFQIKRFRTSKGGDATEQFREYIDNHISKKYPAPGPVRLLMILETTARVDMLTASKQIDWSKFPFTELHFMYWRPNKIYFGEVWPEQYVYSTNPKTVLA